MEIKEDKHNYRIHNKKNLELIEKSMKECQCGRSILIDNKNEIIAGNGAYQVAQKLKIPVKVIETDGSELVVVKRTDLDTNDEKRKKLAVMDNSTSDSSEFDMQLLSIDFDDFKLKEMGIDIPEFDGSEDIEQNDFDDIVENQKNKKIVCPYCGATFTNDTKQSNKCK